jgi:anti-sigma B factor antagonist
MDLSLDTSHDGDQVTVKVAGEIDMHSAPELRDHLAALLDDGSGDVVVGLEDVEFMDSSGLSVLLNAHTALQERGRRLRITGPNAYLMKIFGITGLTDVLDLEPAATSTVETE